MLAVAKELIQSNITSIRPITEYACPVFHNSLNNYLSNELEAIQQRVKRLFSHGRPMARLSLAQVCKPFMLDDKNLEKVCSGISIQIAIINLFHNLLKPLIEIDTTLKNKGRYNLTFKTERLQNSFMTYNG